MQKIEAICISAEASKLSVRNDSDATSRAFSKYIEFLNQFDFVECTFDEKGQKFYRILRERLSIEEHLALIKDQMDALG